LYQNFHSDITGGHFGIEKTLLRINKFYWNADLCKWIKERINHCLVCHKNKAAKLLYNEPHEMPIYSKPMERLQVDIIEPLPKSKNKNPFTVTAVDVATRYLFAKSIPRARAKETIEFLEDIFNEKGVARIIQSDNGKNFVSSEFKEFVKKYNIKHVTSTSYHLQSQGLVERSNKTLRERLRIYCKDPLEWDVDLKPIVLAINSSINKTTRKSPFYLMHGFEPRSVLNNKWSVFPEPGRTTIKKDRFKARLKIQKEQKRILDRRKRKEKSRCRDLDVGDLILWKVFVVDRNRRKHLTAKFKGPFIVVKILPKGCVVCASPKTNKEYVINKGQLRKFFGKKPTSYMDILRKYSDK